MRNNQNKRMRGRGSNNNNNRKSSNPLTRVYESNGPDIKIRGSASHVAEKYIQLARDSLASGDPVGAENYYQHAEHYFRMIAAAQEQFRQNQPQPYQPRPDGEQQPQQAQGESFDGDDDDYQGQNNEPGYGNREQQQAYQQQQHHQQQQSRENQHYQPREQHQHNQQQQPYPREAQPPRQPGDSQADVAGLPSFITGGQQQPQASNSGAQNGGHEGQGDRYPLHRRRRRHRGPRPEGSAPSGEPRPTND